MSVKETDRELRARRAGSISEPASAAWTLAHRFDRNSTSASNMNSNRGGTAWRRLRGHAVACAVGPPRSGSPPAARQIPVALLLEGRPVARARVRRRILTSAGTVTIGRSPPLWTQKHGGKCTGCPDGGRTGTCQQILLKAADRELASRSADLPWGFAQSPTATRYLVTKFRLTTCA